MLRRLCTLALLVLAVGAVAVAPSSSSSSRFTDVRPSKQPHAFAYRDGQCVDDGPVPGLVFSRESARWVAGEKVDRAR